MRGSGKTVFTIWIVAMFLTIVRAQDPGCQFTGARLWRRQSQTMCSSTSVFMPNNVQTAPPRASVSKTNTAHQSIEGEPTWPAKSGQAVMRSNNPLIH